MCNPSVLSCRYRTKSQMIISTPLHISTEIADGVLYDLEVAEEPQLPEFEACKVSFKKAFRLLTAASGSSTDRSWSFTSSYHRSAFELRTVSTRPPESSKFVDLRALLTPALDSGMFNLLYEIQVTITMSSSG